MTLSRPLVGDVVHLTPDPCTELEPWEHDVDYLLLYYFWIGEDEIAALVDMNDEHHVVWAVPSLCSKKV